MQTEESGSKGGSMSRVSNERGAILALMALLMIIFLGLAALAVDLGMLYVARGEAQRAADAAAHAGAGHLQQNFGDEAGAREVAVQVGALNQIRGQPAQIDPQEDIDIPAGEGLVRVRARRIAERGNAVGTLFAAAIGFRTMDIGASGAARVWPATASDCVLPLALPDRWCTSPDGMGGCAEYSDGLESGQSFDANAGHYYEPWLDPATQEPNPEWTGYSDANFGDPLIIKPQGPQGSPQPGWYYAFRLPGSSGANDFRNSISGCMTGDEEWGVGDIVYTEQGNMVGPTSQGFNDVLNEYPDAYWDTSTNRPGGNPDHIAGRTRPIALFDPTQPPSGGTSPFEIANFAAVFIEGFDSNGDVIVRFVELTGLRPAPGWDPSQGGPGTQLTVIRIVE